MHIYMHPLSSFTLMLRFTLLIHSFHSFIPSLVLNVWGTVLSPANTRRTGNSFFKRFFVPSPVVAEHNKPMSRMHFGELVQSLTYKLSSCLSFYYTHWSLNHPRLIDLSFNRAMEWMVGRGQEKACQTRERVVFHEPDILFLSVSQRLSNSVHCWHGFNLWSTKPWPHPPPQVLGSFSCTFSTDFKKKKKKQMLKFITIFFSVDLSYWLDSIYKSGEIIICFCHLLL